MGPELVWKTHSDLGTTGEAHGVPVGAGSSVVWWAELSSGNVVNLVATEQSKQDVQLCSDYYIICIMREW